MSLNSVNLLIVFEVVISFIAFFLVLCSAINCMLKISTGKGFAIIIFNIIVIIGIINIFFLAIVIRKAAVAISSFVH